MIDYLHNTLMIPNNPEPNDRFREIYNELRESGKIKSDAEFAKLTGWNTSSLSLSLSGKRSVPTWVLQKFAELYKIHPSEFGLQPERKVTIISDEDWIRIVKADQIQAYARSCQDEKFIQSLDKFIAYYDNTEPVRFFVVPNDAMHPALPPLCFVGSVKISKDRWKSLAGDGVYVVVCLEDAYIRRLTLCEDCVKLIADNPFYKEIRKDYKEIKEIWFVRSKTTTNIPSPQNEEGNQQIKDNTEKLNALEERVNELTRLLKSGL